MGPLNGTTPASIVIVTYNSARHLPGLLSALRADVTGASEVIVVDNASSDGSAQIARDSGATVVPMGHNVGFAAACHAGVAAASHDAVVLLNPDTVPQPGWLPPLLDALDQPGVGAASPTIQLSDSPGHFNTSGGALTFYGVAWATDVGEPISDDEEIVDTPFPSGAAMAMSRPLWNRLGGFREEFFMYHEDSDLGWRLRLSGLRSVRVPASTVSHTYEFARNPDKMFYLERNRLLMLAANYRPKTLALLGPALLAVEIAITVLAVRDGWFRAKARAWRGAWRLRETASARRRTLDRAIDDREMLESLESSPTNVSQVAVPMARAVGWLLGGYLRIVRRLV